ncbi:MAG: hypothetical protein A2168_05600 [Planctomycetes bacterium RBG_13_50_24]|nr:MAG: hypothetical protein A2168_05600 [Planctomycetes bacterium RBG_13_50_24]
MPRPRHCRRVARLPEANYYKPRGVPLSVLEEVMLTVDEFEAIRLTDLEGLYQADAAEKMNISRQTLGRILESAHKKIADALVHGKALLIKGGPIEINTEVSENAPPQRFGPGRRGEERGRGRCRRGPRGAGN